MTPREKHPQGPPKLGTHNTWHSLQVAQQAGDFLSRCLIWSKRFPGYLGWFLFFPGNWGALRVLFSAPFLCSLTSTSLGEALEFIASSVMEGLSECGQFQGLPTAVLSCLSFCFRSFPLEGMFEVLLETFAYHTLTQYPAFMNFSENDELPFTGEYWLAKFV